MKRALIPVVVAVIVGFSLVWVANIISGTVVSIKNKGYVTVKGFAKKAIKSDLGIFSATIVREDENLQVCYKNVTADKKKVKNFLKRFGIRKENIEFYPTQIGERYKINERGYATDEFINYKLSQTFKVESNNVASIAELSERISELLDDGVKMFVSSPEYVYTKLDDLKVEMIGKATANAKMRADIIAKRGRFRLGSISSVRVGIFQITPLHSTDVSDYGINDTTSIEKEIKSVVEVRYFVK
ncbi:MAG: SIMPL domain-containing protein [Candidatus Omnitrophota bacterium]|nr:MAG: SIMPL domain-containing protein [Candidatus Omnitrophota bacterium]